MKTYQIVSTLDYRNIHLDFYLEEDNQSIFTFWPETNELISFGSYNADFKDEAKFLIDEHLDVIAVNSDFGEGIFGVKLSYFDNAGNRDIKLTYKQRILKVYLVVIPSQVDLKYLIEDAKSVLNKVIK